MDRRRRAALILALVAALALGGGWLALRPHPLRVCADPNNLPFSNRAGEGFENRLAELLGRELRRPVAYVWWAQRRGFVGNTIGAGTCDVWPGVTSGLETLATTRPYYRSSYVFVTREADALTGLTLDDPRLRRLRIGVQLVGDDGSNTPPAQALVRRGIVDNVTGFMLYGDYGRPSPAAEIVRAVADRRIDVALVWGPVAGYFARRVKPALRIEPVTPWLDDRAWPMAFDIAVGVRKDDPGLRKEIDRALARHRGEIKALLASYGVPSAGDEITTR